MAKEKNKLVYLLAASHSGTTLTAMLLGAHPDVCTVGELKAIHLGDINSYLCSCQTRVKECSFWNGICEKMNAKGEEFDITNAGMDIRSNASSYVNRLLKPLVRGRAIEAIRDILLSLSPVWRKQLPIIQRRNAAYVESIVEQTDVKVVIDSSKIGIRLKYLLKNPNLDIKVVWVTRDGRGVSLAYRNPNEFADAADPKHRGGGVGKSQEQPRGVEVGAKEWRRCNEEAQAVIDTLDPKSWIRVRYEDICNNTVSELDKIYEFIGVDPSKKRLDFKSVDHHVVGNGMRLDSDDTIRLDERWRDELTAQELDWFEESAGEMNRQFGYK